MVDFRFFQSELTLAGGLLNMKMESGLDFGHRYIRYKKESIKRIYFRNVQSQSLIPRREDAGSIIKPPSKSDEVPSW
jgi:hypothetical protein